MIEIETTAPLFIFIFVVAHLRAAVLMLAAVVFRPPYLAAGASTAERLMSTPADQAGAPRKALGFAAFTRTTGTP